MDQSWCTLHDWTLWIVSWVIFDSYCGCYGHYHFLGLKMSKNTHICPYLPFPTTNTPRKWINLDVLSMTGLCGSFPGWFLTVIKDFMEIFIFRGKKCPKKHISCRIYPFQWQIHPGNGSILMYSPLLDFVDHFLGDLWQLLRILCAFSLFGQKKCKKNTYLVVRLTRYHAVWLSPLHWDNLMYNQEINHYLSLPLEKVTEHVPLVNLMYNPQI